MAPEGATHDKDIPMTHLRTVLAGTAALLTLPLAAGAQTAPQEQALPQELSGLDLSDVHDNGDGDGREIRATLDGTRFEIEYDDGRIEEITAAPDATLPQAVLEAMVPAEILSAAGDMGIGDIVQVEFNDDDGEVELNGTDGDGPVEATFSSDGQMTEFDRSDDGRGPPDHAIRHDLTPDDVRRIAAEAGYENVEWIEIRPNHVEFDAVDANGQRMEVRLDGDGQIEHTERR